MGQLTTAVQRLSKHVDDQGKKLDRISHITTAAAAVVTLIVAAVGWVLSIFGGVAAEVLRKSLTE